MGYELIKTTLTLLVFSGCTFLFVSYSLPFLIYIAKKFTRKSKRSSLHEIISLGAVAFCFCLASLSNVLGLSMELGCFVAGVILNTQRSTKAIIPSLDSISTFFSIPFFVSIGLHIYPPFLYKQLFTLLSLTGLVIFLKGSLCYGIMLVFGYHSSTAAPIALGLSQISEFAFILASRAKALGWMSREVYYLTMGTTALTLIAIPVAWKLLVKPSTVHEYSYAD